MMPLEIQVIFLRCLRDPPDSPGKCSLAGAGTCSASHSCPLSIGSGEDWHVASGGSKWTKIRTAPRASGARPNGGKACLPPTSSPTVWMTRGAVPGYRQPRKAPWLPSGKITPSRHERQCDQIPLVEKKGGGASYFGLI